MKKKWTPHIITVAALVVFIVLGLSCGSIESNIEYVFDNKSSYIVQITLSQPHATSKPTEDYKPEKNLSTITVYREATATVYVDNANVDFQWTTSSAGDNSKVYCTTSGAKATFKNR